MTIEEALARHLRPGMTVFVDSTALAAARGMVEVFGGTQPGFTVVVPRGGMIVPELVAGGVVAKVVSGGLLNPHLGRVPPPIVQEAYRSGQVEFELLTLQTVAMRLMGAAMGWPFVPSRSIADSDLETSFPSTARRVRDPFRHTDAVVLRPLVTDLAIGHATAADRTGRAVFPASSDHGGWGLRSARRGVLVVAEVVLDEVGADVPGQRFVPASEVVACCEHPGAAQPYGFDGRLDPVVRPYPADASQIAPLLSPACSARPTVTGADGQPIAAPGRNQHALRPRAASSGGPPRDIGTAESVYLAGSELARRIRRGGIRAVLEGSGKAKAVTDYAVSVLAAEGIVLDRIGGIGGLRAEGVGPSPIEAYGYLLGGPGRASLGCISALQVDRDGNVNNTALPEGPLMLVGSGGSNDAAGACAELVVLTSGAPETLVRRADFVTVPGGKVGLLIAGRCVFERADDGVLELVRVFERVTPDAQALINRAEQCGWRVAPDLLRIPAPGEAQRAIVETALARSH